MGIWLFASGICEAAQQALPIPEAAIHELQQRLVATEDIESTTERRRALKRVARGALSVLDEQAKAPNRFLVLNLLFRTQKELMVLRNDERTRSELLDTCRKLVGAPFDYAAERLEPEVLLMQLELDANGATEHEQAVAVAELADRYRGTPGEIDSLIVAVELAFNLGEAGLLRAVRGALASKFRESTKAIGFLKDRFNSKSSSLMFRGSFKREDGETIVFPIDRAGHVYLSFFWSRDTRHLKERITEVKELQAKYPGKFEVFSFNLDELPDAGKSTLTQMGLDWAPMHLPGGSNNELFRSCTSDPQFLIRITNCHGYIVLIPIDPKPNRFGRRFGVEEYLNITRDKDPYLSVMQSLRIGDFLVGVGSEETEYRSASAEMLQRDKISKDGETVLSEKLQAIQDCFVPAPMRYRLTREEAMANYTRAVKLGAAMFKRQEVRGGQLSFVHNRRIIA